MVSLNVHPIFVHFPIALLSVYALIEIFRLPIITKQQWYFPVKAVLLFVGVAGSAAALGSGQLAQEAYRNTTTMNLVRVHSNFAWYTVYVYVFLTALYLIESLHRVDVASHLPQSLQSVWAFIRRLQLVLFNVPVLMIFSLGGLVLLTITGGLGGAIVYGPDVDPVVSIVYHLFFTK